MVRRKVLSFLLVNRRGEVIAQLSHKTFLRKSVTRLPCSGFIAVPDPDPYQEREAEAVSGETGKRQASNRFRKWLTLSRGREKQSDPNETVTTTPGFSSLICTPNTLPTVPKERPMRHLPSGLSDSPHVL